MAIIQSNRSFPGNRAGSSDRAPSEFFANLGFTVTNPETGEELFVQLEGVTCAFDKLTTRKVFGQNALLNAGIEHTNNWSQGVKAIMAALEPGESSPTLDIQLQIRRTKPVEEVPAPTLDMAVSDPILAAALAQMKAKKAALAAPTNGEADNSDITADDDDFVA